MSRVYEFRCSVHGFIPVNAWERTIIDHPAFQRLRRIRQLAWTDQVYPGAMHTRFEHSLGVMHVATRLFDEVVKRSGDFLKQRYGFDDDGFKRDKVLVRLAALLHDVAHGPFSHAAEDLFPVRPGTQRRYAHEEYSAAIIRHQLRDVIDGRPESENAGFGADDIAALIEGSSRLSARRLFWRELISGQMDADRMDYLLRDSLHAGVDYGKYDWRRLMNTVAAVENPGEGGGQESPTYRLGVGEGGLHAAEALILARYFMFNQVYFHKTRVAYDLHLRHALAAMLPGGTFPPPEVATLEEFTSWDDWKVLGRLAAGEGGEHGARLRRRDHYRAVYRTPERPTEAELEELQHVQDGLTGFVIHREEAGKSWYKVTAADDIPVLLHTGDVKPLSALSGVVGTLPPSRRTFLLTPPDQAEAARAAVADLRRPKEENR